MIDVLKKDGIRLKRGDRVYHKNTPQYVGTVRKGNYLGYGGVDVILDSCRTVIYDVKDVVKIQNESIGSNIKCCPYCRSEEYYIKQSFKGTCDYHIRFDGKEAENGEMHSNAEYKNTSKYAWCSECNKRLFKLEE